MSLGKSVEMCIKLKKNFDCKKILNLLLVITKRYLNLEMEAKREKLGLWEGKFEMPWDWRKNAKN